MKAVDKLGDNAEIGTTTANAEEEISVRGGIGGNDRTIGGDDCCLRLF